MAATNGFVTGSTGLSGSGRSPLPAMLAAEPRGKGVQLDARGGVLRAKRPRFRDQVRDIVLVASASRSGSSVLSEWLRRSGALWHLHGEPNPLLRSVGLMGENSCDDVLTAKDVPEDSHLDELFAYDVGRPLAPRARVDLDRLADDWHLRLTLQWPEEHISLREVQARAAEAVSAMAHSPERAFDANHFALHFIGSISRSHPRVNSYYYDFRATAVREHYPDLLFPSGPPSETLIEEPPFIVVLPWHHASAAELGEQPLVLKSPSLGYQMGFCRALFDGARLRVLHLTRNPAASINGLLDGWEHQGFFSRHLPDRLRIRGYSDVNDAWARSWWKFELPPGWERYAGASLGEVCAFQWASTNEAILRALEDPPVDVLHVRFEDFIAPGGRALPTRERIREWLGLSGTGAGDTLPLVMSTRPPAPGRWRAREAEITPLLESEMVRSVAYALGYGGDHAEWT